MTDKQPTALFLAEQMEDGRWQGMNDLLAAAELRRLYEENQQWQDKCQAYIDLHDSVVKDSDRLYALNAELVSFVSFVLSGLNTGSIKAKPILDFRNEDANEIPIISLASMARVALAKAEGK